MRTRLVVLLALGMLGVLALPAAAHAWANGPDGGNGFGTHDWILAQANRLAAAKRAGWVDLAVALPHTDDPDTVFHDFYYHVYERWNGHHYGDAPKKVSSWYAKALTDRRAKKWRAASVDVGILAHYVGDLCQPMHTDQTALEDTVHSSYEDVVDNLTTSASSLQSWAHFDGYQPPGNVTGFAVTLASASHKDYSALVRDYAAHGWDDATVRAITRRSLDRAANAMADLLIALRKGAPGGGSTGGGGGSGGEALAQVAASVSNAHPAQYASVTAKATCTDAKGKPVSGVKVTFTWRYKTTTPEETLTTGSSGVASCTRSIGAATTGYYVSIGVSATLKGVTKTASTGFTPR